MPLFCIYECFKMYISIDSFRILILIHFYSIQLDDFSAKGEEQLSQIKRSTSKTAESSLPVGSYAEYVKRVHQEQQILARLTEKGELKLNLGLRLEAFFQHWFER
jgi:hypothetical protein